VFVGLVNDPGSGWRPPGEPPEPRAWNIQIPWRVLAWISFLIAALAVSVEIDGFPGYVFMLAALTVGGRRLERSFGGQSRGLRDYQS